MPSGIYKRTPEMYLTRKGKIPKCAGWNKGKPAWNKNKKWDEWLSKDKQELLLRNLNGQNGKSVWNKGLKGYKAKELHYNWQGGITEFHLQIRNCFEYYQWRNNIFIRDKFTCQNCKDNKGRNLIAHHKIEFNQIIKENEIKTLEQALLCEELWDINNGITLCINCHIKLHSIKNKKLCLSTNAQL